jgi:hypothetical protein
LPEVPACVSGLHAAWHQLAAARQSGLGRNLLSWSEIAAWQQIMGVRLNPWEVETISAMDRAALAVPTDQ